MRTHPAVLAFLLYAPLLSADAATIRLYDGTIIRGEIVRFEGGRYTIETEALGTLDVPEGQIEGIEFNSDAPRETAPSKSPISADQLQSLQRELVLSPGIFEQIQGLQDDPAVRSVLEDPAVQAAITSGNYGALLNNPEFLALLRHPRIQAITRDFLSRQ